MKKQKTHPCEFSQRGQFAFLKLMLALAVIVACAGGRASAQYQGTFPFMGSFQPLNSWWLMPPPHDVFSFLTPVAPATPAAAAPAAAAASKAATAAPAAPVAAAPGAKPGTTEGAVPFSTPAPAPRSTKHEVSVSGDFLLGEGTVSLPLGYSLQETLGGLASVPVSAVEADRSSTYLGGTISYSFGQSWYVDLSYARGESTGEQDLDAGSLGSLPSEFEITDEWYQVYVRYTFPALRGKRLSAYVRAGASFVQADLLINSTIPALGRYTQTDETQDLLGNVGFGLGYSLHSSRRSRFGLQFEGEGFFGNRTQDSLEILGGDPGLDFQTVTIDNTLYGGIARVTFRFEYRLGRSGLFKIFADGGAQARYTLITYPDADSVTEFLWGPYVKIGARYAF